MKRRFWTPPELQLLRDHYADSRTLDIAAALQRSERTVYAMARKLGLRKSQQYMREVHGPIAVAAAAMLARISAATERKPIAWRLTSEADGRVLQRCQGDGGWVDAYHPEGVE